MVPLISNTAVGTSAFSLFLPAVFDRWILVFDVDLKRNDLKRNEASRVRIARARGSRSWIFRHTSTRPAPPPPTQQPSPPLSSSNPPSSKTLTYTAPLAHTMPGPGERHEHPGKGEGHEGGHGGGHVSLLCVYHLESRSVL